MGMLPLVGQQFDASQKRRGRPPQDRRRAEALVVRLAQENRCWDCDSLVGALVHLGYTISDEAIGHILKRQGIPPAPEHKQTTT